MLSPIAATLLRVISPLNFRQAQSHRCRILGRVGRIVPAELIAGNRPQHTSGLILHRQLLSNSAGLSRLPLAVVFVSRSIVLIDQSGALLRQIDMLEHMGIVLFLCRSTLLSGQLQGQRRRLLAVPRCSPILAAAPQLDSATDPSGGETSYTKHH
jgi:hypothetical protein